MSIQNSHTTFSIKGEPQAVTDARQLILDSFRELEFTEEGHIYQLHGQVLPSVTQVVERFIAAPFDCEQQAIAYAQKHGYTPEYWIEKWRKNSFRASTLGTIAHAFGESLAYLRAGRPDLLNPIMKLRFLEEYNYLLPVLPKEEAVVQFLDMMDQKPNMHLVLNETRVFSGLNPDPARNLKEQICGTFDMLYYFDGNGDADKAGFVVYDYKTNSSLENDYNRENKKNLLSPFDQMVEEPRSLYTLQLSLYSLMLEDIGLRVIGRCLVWLKDDGTFEIIKLDDVSERLRNAL